MATVDSISSKSYLLLPFLGRLPFLLRFFFVLVLLRPWLSIQRRFLTTHKM
jgi:hypothetical protein